MIYQDILEKGYFYHIYNRGNNKEKLFRERENYFFFLRQAAKYITPIADVFSYCILSNHFHFIIQIKDEKEIDEEKLHQPFSNWFNSYAKAFNKRYGREGSLFTERYRRRRLKDENDLKNLILYVHLNPVKHGYEVDFRNYPHSSYQSIISQKPTLLKREFVLNLFDNKRNFIDSHQIKLLEKFDLEI